MPIVERDPWRQQYFEGVACPADLVIPTDDETAYVLFPEYRWVYNKLLICESQGIAAAPHGVPPESFPVFSKPIYNMYGMGVAGRVIEDVGSLARNAQPGHLWMELLEGEHLSSDVALVGGEAQWWRHTSGVAIEGGDLETAAAVRIEDIDLALSHTTDREFRVRDADPLSARTTVSERLGLARDTWRIRVEASTVTTADAESFRVEATLRAGEGKREVFSRCWDELLPRDVL